MRILMLLEVDFPPDNRVEKEAFSLIAAGHQVDIACYTFSNQASHEIVNGISLFKKPISQFLYKSSVAALLLPFYFNFWEKYIETLIRDNQYDVIHVHDLPLTKPAYRLCKKHKLRLVCDQHEYYSNWIVHTAHMQRGLGRIIGLFSNWKRYEHKYLPKADLVITVAEALRETYLLNRCVAEEKIIMVPNTPLKSVFNHSNIRNDITGRYKDDWMLFYAGGLDRLRGLEVVLKALPAIKREIPNIRLVLGGRLSKGFDLMGLAEELDIIDLIEHHPWIETKDMPSYLSVAKLGFFTPPGNREEIHNTIATKIYQYLAMDVPVIVSDVRLMKEFVLEHGIGLIASNETEFERAVIGLYTYPDKRDRLVENCRKYNSEYTWEKTISVLLDQYARF
jgi:glycosyltransferase involved in cell wall biosynthesis